MIKRVISIATILLVMVVNAQEEQKKALQFSGDFRFRIEEDWDSRKSDGSYRDDRGRLRYRFRLGVNYFYEDWAEVGARIRTGSLHDQQGPHVTLGSGGGEFSTVQMGFEKLYFKAKYKGFSGWIGKNTFPFYKKTELFWNDNVYPEGIAMQHKTKINTNSINSIQFNTGHFVIVSNNESFDKDSYFQALQLITEHFDNTLVFYPGFFYFKNIENIPDGKGSFTQDYKILNLGLSYSMLQNKNLSIGVEWYSNFKDLQDVEEIPSDFEKEKNGYVAHIKLGKLRKAKDWTFQFYYAHIEKYAIVDYFAQNDWARWDYSSLEATGSRLSNMKGLELRIGYAINEKLNLIFRGYTTEQIKKENVFVETGKRVRLDLNFKF